MYSTYCEIISFHGHTWFDDDGQIPWHVNKYLIGIFNLWIALPTKMHEKKTNEKKKISQYVLIPCSLTAM